MKIFLDTANLEAIKKWAFLIDGVTTNPTHLSKEESNPTQQVQKICALLKNKDISVEVTEQKPEAVYEQAKKIAKLGNNIIVKIPCHEQYYEVIQKLVQEKIQINVTLVFTLIQGLLMCKLGVKYISPFIGRLDDIDVPGSDLLFEMRQMVSQYDYTTQILAASLRTVRNVHEAILADADVATLPIQVFEKMIQHPLTDRGIEKFNADWQKLGIKQFP